MTEQRPIKPTTAKTCEEYERAMSEGRDPDEVIAQLAERAGVHRSAIRARLRYGGTTPRYPSERGEYVVPVRREKMAKPILPELPPSRDPCRRCGARGDYDCGHPKALLTW